MFRLLLALVLPAGALVLLPEPRWALAAAAWMLSVSSVLFLLYRTDKKRAQRDERRVSERTLHQLALLGGWPGALLGQTTFRHKTAKRPFQVVTWGIVALHQFGAIAWIGHQSLPGGWTSLW